MFGTVSDKDIQDGTEPIGSIMAYASSIEPYVINAKKYWKICNGALVNIKDYPFLYPIIGTTYNTGGETPGVTFRMPNLVDKMIRGVGTTALGATAGSDTADVTHTHGLTGASAADGAGTKHYHNLAIYGTVSAPTESEGPNYVGYRTTASGGDGFIEFMSGSGGPVTVQRVYPYTVITNEGGHTHAISGSTDASTRSSIATVPVHMGLNYIIKYR